MTSELVMKAALVMLMGALPLLIAEPYRYEWQHITPVIRSEVQKLQPTEAENLLRNFCTQGIRKVDQSGLECSTHDLGPAFGDIVDNKFHPEGVVYGHFLSAGSEDAAVSGWSAETHPSLWGGTLFLKKQRGVWIPLWYESAVITHSCQKGATPSRREILLCEDEDGSMGHKLHNMYSVDLMKPTDRRVSPLAVADSFENSCVIRKQQIERVEWVQGQAQLSLIVTIGTPEWRRLSHETCAGDPLAQPRPPLNARLIFHLRDTGFTRAQTAR